MLETLIVPEYFFLDLETLERRSFQGWQIGIYNQRDGTTIWGEAALVSYDATGLMVTIQYSWAVFRHTTGDWRKTDHKERLQVIFIDSQSESREPEEDGGCIFYFADDGWVTAFFHPPGHQEKCEARWMGLKRMALRP